jgi:radical SAM enzyme (TIGR04100 family)
MLSLLFNYNGGIKLTILYTIQSGKFIDLKKVINFKEAIIDHIYVNITNNCHCSCTFCIRNNKKEAEEDDLWLEREPDIEEIIKEFEKVDINNCKEIIFCGFGEPLERMDVVTEVSKHLKSKNPKVEIRLNTNGLANLIHNKDITAELKGIIDTASISLNAPSKEKYLEITNSKFGIESFDGMLDFANKCKQYIPNVILSVVDILSKEEIKKCKEICETMGVKFRIRYKI